ncbi:asparaginase [bacterium]|nr:asparaginase [bacterium]
MKIRIFTCGGTIDKIYFDSKSKFEVGEPQVASILRESKVTLQYAVESILQKDSLDMNDEDRERIRSIVENTRETRILLTHGTDTMIQTARMLECVKDKTIVLTGSLEPARFRVTDAIFNIGCAITAVQILPHGVYIAMNGRLFEPGNVKKNLEKNCFETI